MKFIIATFPPIGDFVNYFFFLESYFSHGVISSFSKFTVIKVIRTNYNCLWIVLVLKQNCIYIRIRTKLYTYRYILYYNWSSLYFPIFSYVVQQLIRQYEYSYFSLMGCYVQTKIICSLLILWNISLDKVFQNGCFHFLFCNVIIFYIQGEYKLFFTKLEGW